MDGTARVVCYLVSRILYEFEELAVAVSTLGDATFAVGVLGNETGIYFIGLQNARGLFEDGANDR
ncbi:hypothetical protein ABT081_00855 [Streptomyces sp. NPDC002238]|uniref:hypothetical protein n=1 Tax=Streptomyces sp. NPDC002238 TaxID=3156649 RepID=UPI00331AD9C7